MIKLTLNDWIAVISHWNEIVFATKKENFEIKYFGEIDYKQNDKTKCVSYSSSGCRFCELFRNKDCKYCPVKLSNKKGCLGSPYLDFADSYSQKNLHKYAIHERDFLLSLAPKKYLKQLNFISNLKN